jgi:ABC-2 type transport system ATP-binding protein
MKPIVEISNLSKTYSDGQAALIDINLDIQQGEILALLGPNGAGKTTLISIICGLVNLTSGSVTVGGYDIIRQYRQTRSKIGLVPQELKTDAFQSVWDAVRFSRGLFGKPQDPAHTEKIIRDLALWDKKDSQIIRLSGGMKRRVMIAKALSHEPEILFLDEPSAGVDVELRKDMWRMIRELRDTGVTIILTTHYIEEAEEMADRVGIISQGRLLLVDDKQELMKQMGSKQLSLDLQTKMTEIPDTLAAHELSLSPDGMILTYAYDTRASRTGISALLADLSAAEIRFRDLKTSQSSLEDIFVQMVKETS